MPKLQHVAIIPDGNRRWAKAKGLPSFMGHQEGAKTAEKILNHALSLKIPYLTFWGASIDNVTKRDKVETEFLFKLFEDYFKKLLKNKEIQENEVRIHAFGEWRTYFSPSCRAAIEEAVEKTKHYNKFHLNFLLAYSGIGEMTAAVSQIAQLAKEQSELVVTPELIKQNLFTVGMPPVDLVVRTGGEPHFSSGFMMWDVADAHLYFTETFYPDFSVEEFGKAIEEFESRERRLGK
jgi:undecaprenyl diphosphate synthase